MTNAIISKRKKIKIIVNFLSNDYMEIISKAYKYLQNTTFYKLVRIIERKMNVCYYGKYRENKESKRAYIPEVPQPRI
jgi:hypothetical protein